MNVATIHRLHTMSGLFTHTHIHTHTHTLTHTQHTHNHTHTVFLSHTRTHSLSLTHRKNLQKSKSVDWFWLLGCGIYNRSICTSIALLWITTSTGTALILTPRTFQGPKRKDKKLIVVTNISISTENRESKSVYRIGEMWPPRNKPYIEKP